MASCEGNIFKYKLHTNSCRIVCRRCMRKLNISEVRISGVLQYALLKSGR